MIIGYEWAMPNHKTFDIKPINGWIKAHLKEGLILDPFALRGSVFQGFGRIITNDINPNAFTDYNLDALEFLQQYDDESVDSVLFDPPYSLRQLKECYGGLGVALTQHQSQRFFSDLKDQISRVLKPGGVCLTFGWSSVGIGKSRGFEKRALLVVCHGGIHNDTLCLMEVKK
jgi:hypothetical protein